MFVENSKSCAMEKEEIEKFLNKLDLEDYLNDFTGEQCLYSVKKLEDFALYLQNEKGLEDIGLTDVEIKRFVRMCNQTIQVSNNLILLKRN